MPATPQWTFKPAEIPVEGQDITFVVARRSSRLIASRVEVANKVGADLRERISATLDQFAERQPRQFEPDLVVDPSEDFLNVPLASVTHVGAQKSEDGEVAETELDAELVQVLGDAANLPTIAAADIPKVGFQLYAVAIGNEPGKRVTFVRKSNPRSAVRPGKLITTFGERLKKVEEPVLILDESFDLVVTPEGIAALNQRAFEMLFRDASSMQGRYPAYVAAITASLPIAGDGAAVLAERASTT